MENIKAVIFDMDGVLLDTETISNRTWKIAAKEYGINNIDTILKTILGRSAHDIYTIMQKEFSNKINVENFLERTTNLFYKIEKDEGIPLMKGAISALEYLSQKNYRIALASSTKEITVRRQLTNANIINYFETITTGDMVSHSKPNPEIYTLACKSLSLESKHCIAIEDSPNGIKSAKEAGLTCIMIPDKIQADEQIKKLCNYILPSLENIKEVL